MASPGLVRGTFTQAKAILRFFISGHRLDHGLYGITADRSRYRHTRFRDTYHCGLWTARRLASRVHQHLAARTLVASV